MATITVTIKEGKGIVYAYSGIFYKGLVNEINSPQTFTYNLNDEFTFKANDLTVGFAFDKFCRPIPFWPDECITTNPFTGTVTADSGNLDVYFKTVSQKVLYLVRTQGEGSVEIRRVLSESAPLVKTLTESEISTFAILNPDDTFRLIASPKTGYDFRQFCDPTIGMTGTCWTTNPLDGNAPGSGVFDPISIFRQVYFLQQGDHYRCTSDYHCIVDNINGTLSQTDCQRVCRDPSTSTDIWTFVNNKTEKLNIQKGESFTVKVTSSPNKYTEIKDGAILGVGGDVLYGGVTDTNGNLERTFSFNEDKELNISAVQDCLLFVCKYSNTVNVVVGEPCKWLDISCKLSKLSVTVKLGLLSVLVVGGYVAYKVVTAPRPDVDIKTPTGFGLSIKKHETKK